MWQAGAAWEGLGEGIGDGEGAAGEEMLMMQRPVRNNEDEMVASRIEM